jgi:hypothetical protein
LNGNYTELRGSELHAQAEDTIQVVFLSIRNKQLLNMCSHLLDRFEGKHGRIKSEFLKFQKYLRKYDEITQRFMEVHERIIQRFPQAITFLFSETIQRHIEDILVNGPENLTCFNSAIHKYTSSQDQLA